MESHSLYWLVPVVTFLLWSLLSLFSWKRQNSGRGLLQNPNLKQVMLAFGVLFVWIALLTSDWREDVSLSVACIFFLGMCYVARMQRKNSLSIKK